MSDFKKNPTVNGSQIWNAGNDGHGSSLDADTLDGKHASDLCPYVHTHSSIDITDTIAVKANPLTTQNISANVNTKVNFGSEVYDFGPAYDDLTSRFTNIKPHLSIFRVSCNIFLNSTTSGSLMVYKNGIEDVTSRLFNATSNTSNFNGYVDVDMNPSDYLEIFIRVGTARTILTTSSLSVSSVT